MSFQSTIRFFGVVLITLSMISGQPSIFAVTSMTFSASTAFPQDSAALPLSYKMEYQF